MSGIGPISGVTRLELSYVEFTAPVNVTATTEATANTIVTGGAIAYDGSTVVRIEFFAPNANVDAGGVHDLWLVLYDGASSIGFLGIMSSLGVGYQFIPMNLSRRLTPSNASHTYSVRAYVDYGTGNVGAGAGGVGNSMPGFIRVTKV